MSDRSTPADQQEHFMDLARRFRVAPCPTCGHDAAVSRASSEVEVCSGCIRKDDDDIDYHSPRYLQKLKLAIWLHSLKAQRADTPRD